MILTRIKIFKNVGGDWMDECTGVISRLHRDAMSVEDDVSGSVAVLPLADKAYRKSEEIIVIVHDESEEHAICFETEDVRDAFFEFLVLGDDVREAGEMERNRFVLLARASRWMEDSVFGEVLESRDKVLDALNTGNFHLFRMLVESRERIFSLFEIPFRDRVLPHTFYTEFVAKRVDEELLETYERFLAVMNRQILTKRETEVCTMSDVEMRDFLKRCCSNGHRPGDAEKYLDRMHADSELFPETFYYLCQMFKTKMAEAVDFRTVLKRARDLVPDTDALYLLEGMCTILDACSVEMLDAFYSELLGFFDDVEHQPDLQRLLLALFSAYNFRVREFLISTGLLKRIFAAEHTDARAELFVAKMFCRVVAHGAGPMHAYFVRNNLLRGVAEMYRGRSKDAVYSALLQAFSQAEGDLKRLLDAHM